MYFSGKRYFNQNTPSVVLIKDRPKPPARKKGKLTRKKKAKKKYNFTQLKKQLGNDMIIKLLLRLVEGRANPSKVGRPPKESKKQYDIYGNELTRKGRRMRLARGSGIAAPSRDTNKPPSKKQGEREEVFLKRLEEWLYQNNPYFMYSQNQLKSDLPEKVSVIRSDLNTLIQSLKNNPKSVPTTQYETFEEDTFPYQDKSYIDRLEKVMSGKNTRVRETFLNNFLQEQADRNQALSTDDVVELRRMVKLSDEPQSASRFFGGSEKPSRREAFNKFVRERESEIEQESFGRPRTGGRRGTPVSKRREVVRDVPVGITTEQQERLQAIQTGLEGVESDISLESITAPPPFPKPDLPSRTTRRKQSDSTEIRGGRGRVAETLQTEIRGGTGGLTITKLGGSRVVPDTSESETEPTGFGASFEREQLQTPLFGETFRPPTPRSRTEKPKKKVEVGFLPEGGTESSSGSDENIFKTSGGGTNIDSLLFNLKPSNQPQPKITGGGGRPRLPPREVKIQKLDTSDSELDEPKPPPSFGGAFNEKDMLIGVLLGNKEPTQGGNKAIEEIGSGIDDIITGDRYNPLQDFQANLDISALKSEDSVNLLQKHKKLEDEIGVLVASTEAGVRLTPELQKAKDLYDRANAAVATSRKVSRERTDEPRFADEYYNVLEKFQNESKENYFRVKQKERNAIERLYKAQQDIDDELKRQTGQGVGALKADITAKEEADIVEQIGKLPKPDQFEELMKLDWKNKEEFDKKALTAYGGSQEDLETLQRSKTYKTLIKNVSLGKGHKAKTYDEGWFKSELEKQKKEETLVKKPRGGQTKLLQQVEVGTTKTELELLKEKEEQAEQEQIQTLIAKAKELDFPVDESYVKRFLESSKKAKRPIEEHFIGKIKASQRIARKKEEREQETLQREQLAKQKLAEQTLERELKRIAPNKPLKEYNSPHLSNWNRGTSEANIGQSMFGQEVKRLKAQRQIYLDIAKQQGLTPETISVINDLNKQIGDPLIEKQPVFRPSTPTKPKIQPNPAFQSLTEPETPASVSSGGGIDVIQQTPESKSDLLTESVEVEGTPLTKSQLEDKAKVFSAATLASQRAGEIGEAAYKHSAKKSAEVIGGNVLKAQLRLNKNVADTEELLQQQKSTLLEPEPQPEVKPQTRIQKLRATLGGGKPLPPVKVEDKSSSGEEEQIQPTRRLFVKRAKSIKKLPISPDLKFAKEPPPNFNPVKSSAFDDLTIYPPEYRGKYILFEDNRQPSTKGIKQKYDIDAEGRSENHPEYDMNTGGEWNERNKGVQTADMVFEKRKKEKAKEAARRAAIEPKTEAQKKAQREEREARLAEFGGGGETLTTKQALKARLEETIREPETQEAFQERQDIQEAKRKSITLSFGEDFKPKPKPPPKQSVPALGGGTTYGQQQQTQQLLQALVAPTDVSIEAGLQTSQQLAANPLDTSLAITELPPPPPVESEVDRILRGSTLLGTSGRRTLEQDEIEFGDE